MSDNLINLIERVEKLESYKGELMQRESDIATLFNKNFNFLEEKIEKIEQEIKEKNEFDYTKNNNDNVLFKQDNERIVKLEQQQQEIMKEADATLEIDVKEFKELEQLLQNQIENIKTILSGHLNQHLNSLNFKTEIPFGSLKKLSEQLEKGSGSPLSVEEKQFAQTDKAATEALMREEPSDKPREWDRFSAIIFDILQNMSSIPPLVQDLIIKKCNELDKIYKSLKEDNIKTIQEIVDDLLRLKRARRHELKFDKGGEFIKIYQPISEKWKGRLKK